MRYVNLCRPSKKEKKYETYVQTYKAYEKTEERKEYMKQYNKKYREENDDYILCECGSYYKAISIYSHIKTNKHINYLCN